MCEFDETTVMRAMRERRALRDELLARNPGELEAVEEAERGYSHGAKLSAFRHVLEDACLRHPALEISIRKAWAPAWVDED